MPLEKSSYKGLSVYPGKFYGKCLLLKTYRESTYQPEFISVKAIKKEISRFKKSLRETKKDLEDIYKLQAENFSNTVALDIIQSQITMLEDPMLVDGVPKRIENERESARTALHNVINFITGQMISQDNDFFRERIDHIIDIHKKLEDHLENHSATKQFRNIFKYLEEDVIVVAVDITPSELLAIDKKRVKGIATDLGGRTGHMAILARNFGIPTIVGLRNLTAHIEDGEYVLLDAENGYLTVNPDIEEIEYYETISHIKPDRKKEKKIRQAVTTDGTRIRIRANLETENDCDNAIERGVEGIGLFRSEILFMRNPNHIPTEEEQFQLYRQVLERMKNKPVVIRTFDIGADKLDHIFEEENPFLGNRGIRYTLQNKKLFEDQLTALLRASAFGKLMILLPMVNNISEVRQTREILESCKCNLRKSKIPFSASIKIGIMIETPAAALAIDTFAGECDFFSLGTNDLLQYTTAVDRNNIYVSDLYNPYHVSFLRLIRNSVKTASEMQIPISICGEIASDTHLTVLLIGLGLRDLSIALPFVNEVKRLICSVDIKQAEELADKVMDLAAREKYEMVHAYLFNRHYLDI